MSFFEKFERGEPAGDAGSRRIASIIANLNNVLNTRQGFGSPLPEFGIRDLNEFTAREQIARTVMEEVERNIAAYEPGVTHIEIEMEESGSPFKISFRLRCRIDEHAHSLRMVFDTVVNTIRVDNW